MKRFYVIEQGCYLRKEGNLLKVYLGDRVVEEISLEDLETLTIVGRSSLSGAVLDELIRRRIETVLLTPEGRFRARLVVDEHKHVERRMKQYLKLSDPSVKALIAATVVSSKIQSCAYFVAQRSKEYSDKELGALGLQLKSLAKIASQESTLEVIIGIEGRASNLYFSRFSHLIKAPGFFFESRNRRPPLDPVNALLSFVYTLLTNEVLTAVQRVGLDPYLGALHAVEYGRPSLACDLVEEWRNFLGDRLVLTLINRKIVNPDDFIYHLSEPESGSSNDGEKKPLRPVEMKPRVMRAFIRAYEKWLSRTIRDPFSGKEVTYRGLIYDQARRFLNFIMDKSDRFDPFPWDSIY
ncbi:MAG: CRISPR-associated endonuclease Cas1 [Thermodesulforhabdaceae bacterium]